MNFILTTLKTLIGSTTPSGTTKPWLSKQLWAALIIAAAGFYPPVQVIAVANPEIAGVVAGGIIAVLRLITKQPVSTK